MRKFASQGSRRGRYLTLLLVIGFHIALIAGVLLAAKWRPHRTAPMAPLEIVLLPRESVPPPPPVARPKTRHAPLAPPAAIVRRLPAPAPAQVDTPSLISVPASAPAAPRVDWNQEAHIVAAERARQEPPPPIPGLKSASAPNSVFAPPPAHHRGDEVPLAGGGTAVYVSDNCYQISPAIPVVQNGINNGMALPIYCNSKAKTPRGDLFEQLPAYQKLHPEH